MDGQDLSLKEEYHQLILNCCLSNPNLIRAIGETHRRDTGMINFHEKWQNLYTIVSQKRRNLSIKD